MRATDNSAATHRITFGVTLVLVAVLALLLGLSHASRPLPVNTAPEIIKPAMIAGVAG